MSQVGDLLEYGEQLVAALDDSAAHLSAHELGELSVGLVMSPIGSLRAKVCWFVRPSSPVRTNSTDSNTIGTGRSRISAGYLPGRRCSVMAPSSQGLEPGHYPGVGR